jgi:hypothetical protein
MRVLAAAMISVMVALPAMPAWPQANPPSDERTTLGQQVEQRERQEQQRREEAAAVEKAYQRQLKASGSAPTPKTDPWGNMREPALTKKDSQSKNSK